MNRRGFTIIELIIVIAIMGILLVLAVVNLRSTQVNARDEQRKGDVDAIAQQLEVFYKSGNSSSTTIGRYPSLGIIGQETTTLENIDSKSLISPSSTVDPQTLIAPSTGISSLVAATNNTQTVAGILPKPGTGNDVYTYQPLQSTGALCTTIVQECRKFNLFYWRESDNTVQMISGKNQ